MAFALKLPIFAVYRLRRLLTLLEPVGGTPVEIWFCFSALTTNTVLLCKRQRSITQSLSRSLQLAMSSFTATGAPLVISIDMQS